MFPSCGRGAGTSAPPVQDAFRDVFASRLQAALNSRLNAPKETASRPSRPVSSRPRDSRSGLGTRHAVATRSNPGESRRTSAFQGKKPQEHGPRIDEKSESQATVAVPVTGQSQAAPQPAPNQKGAAAASPPHALRDFMAYLQSLPGGSLKIPPEQVPAVSTFLLSAGLPQAEVDRLLSPAGPQELSLSAADLMAAWQRVQGEGAAGGAALGPNQPPAGTPVASNQAQPGANQHQETPDIRQTQDYRTL